MVSNGLALPVSYGNVLAELKDRVRSAQLQTQRQVNTALVQLYWSIGTTLLQQQQTASWGSGVVERLANDLRTEFPGMKGFSRRNLLYMRAFAAAWPTAEIVQQAVAQLPWGHATVLLDKLDDSAARDWYAASAAQHGWSRNVLLTQILNQTRERTGAAPSNFAARLAPADSDLAHQIAKDPYVFDFLNLSQDAAERTVEQALMDRMIDTLRELGAGFAFVGRQVHFDVNGDDFFLDLLFFHVEQLRYVVVELKTGKFEPSFTGQLSFYIALVDDRLRKSVHAPTVGILICGSKNDHTVRYSLSRADSPMAISTYTYETLPADERAALPAAEQLTAALDWDLDSNSLV